MLHLLRLASDEWVRLVVSLSFAFSILAYEFLNKRLGNRVRGEESYGAKLGRLTGSLQKVSGEVDDLLEEIAAVAKARATAAAELETQLLQLGSREKELKRRIEELNAIPISVAEHFNKLLADGERRSALRDYILFGAGVIVSTVVAIVLRAFKLG